MNRLRPALRGVWLATPVALGAMALPWLDRLPPLCLSRLLAGQRCWGCGIAHAVCHLCRGEIEEAWRCNPLALLVAPLLLWLWFINGNRATGLAALLMRTIANLFRRTLVRFAG